MEESKLQKVYLVSGLPGSGKTHFSRKLAKQLKIEFLDFDDNLNDLISENKKEFEELGAEEFLAKYSSLRYEELTKRVVEKLISPLKQFDPNPTLYWVSIPPALRKERLLKRSNIRDQQKLTNIDQYINQTNLVPPVIDHIVIDGSQ
jgi:adenylate kinase family enzyme